MVRLSPRSFSFSRSSSYSEKSSPARLQSTPNGSPPSKSKSKKSKGDTIKGGFPEAGGVDITIKTKEPSSPRAAPAPALSGPPECPAPPVTPEVPARSNADMPADNSRPPISPPSGALPQVFEDASEDIPIGGVALTTSDSQAVEDIPIGGVALTTSDSQAVGDDVAAVAEDDVQLVHEEAKSMEELRQRYQQQNQEEQMDEQKQEDEEELQAREKANQEEFLRELQSQATREVAERVAAEQDRTRQEAEYEAKLAAMSEEELVSMEVGTKVTSELASAEAALQKAKAELQSTDEVMSSTKEEAVRQQNVKREEIDRLQTVLDCYKTILGCVETYDEQCGFLKDEVTALVTMETQRRMDTHGISSRVRQELSEVQERLSKQTALLNSLQQEWKKAHAEKAISEKQIENELATVSSEVAAKKLALDLARLSLNTVCSEQAKLKEATSDSRAIEARKDRVATTTTQVEEIMAKKIKDEQAIAECKVREAELEEQVKLADALREAKLRAFDADKDSMRSLGALQEAFLEGELAVLEYSAEANTEKKGLLSDTRLLVGDRRALTMQKRKYLEAQEAQYLVEVEAGRQDRDVALRRLRAERKAVEIAHGELQRYLNEKMSQLEIEQKQLWAASCELQDQKDCIAILQKEIDLARQAVEERNSEQELAESRKKEHASRLDSLRLANKLRLAKLRVQIDSEIRVQMEQQSYVGSLESRLKVETGAIIEEPEYLIEEHVNEVVPPLGKQGLALTYQNKEAVSAWAREMKNARKEAEESLERTRGELEAIVKKTAMEVQRTDEIRITQRHEIAKLEQYQLSLKVKLESMTTPVPGTPEASPGTPAPPVAPSLPAPAEMHTPYSATHKYLQISEKFSGKGTDVSVDAFDGLDETLRRSPTSDEARMAIGLHDEEQHPMYNPDLPANSSTMRSSIRTRIEGILPSSRILPDGPET